MASIHVSRGGQSLGVFPESEVQEGLRSGRFLPNDLGWREGMATWQALATFPELGAGPAVPPVPGLTSGVPPTAAMVPGVTVVARNGLPWDRRAELGTFNAFLETLKLVLFQPSIAFATMKTEGGIGEPLIYAFIGGAIGFAVYIVFSVLIHPFGFMAGHRDPLAGMFGGGMGILSAIVLVPLILVLGIFIGAGLLHLCLMLVGGAKRSFETTLRVVCFTVGSTYPLLIVPACGGLVSGIWSIVLECIGIARAHETDTGRAVLAVFLPLVLCCGGGVLLSIMFGAMGAMLSHH